MAEDAVPVARRRRPLVKGAAWLVGIILGLLLLAAAAFWAIEVGFEVELSCSFCIAEMSACGPAVQPMRQPVIE